MTRFVQGRRGFTLMELLTVMVIMSIVLATGVVSYVGARRGAELRGAVISVKTALSMARQHAVTKRRPTAVVFRKQGDATTFTNFYYVVEKIGVAGGRSSGKILNLDPLPANLVGGLVCNMSIPVNIGQIGTNSPVDAEKVQTDWFSGESGVGWSVGNWVGFQANEKMFLPPGVDCQLSNSGNFLVLFYPNGKAYSGSEDVTEKKITLYDKMDTDITKTLTVYPLVGLINAD